MDQNFAKFEIYDSKEKELLHSVVVPISQVHEAYMLFAIGTGNVVKVFDHENVLRINSKLYDSLV